MVSAPTGANVILMSDAGGDNNISQGAVVATDLTFDDQAANQLPADTHFGSTYRPVDDDIDFAEATPVDVWDPPAPTPSNSTMLSTFNSLSPNGVWSLWAVDDTTQAPFDILGGWCIDILTGGGGTTTTTVAPTTTSTTTGSSTTTSTTQLPGSTCTAQLPTRRAQVNAQVDAAKASVVQSVPAERQAQYLAQLEGNRAAANAQIDQALARCPA